MLSAYQTTKRKWNWLDFCFIVFILALIATLLFRWDVIHQFRQDRSAQQAEITVCVSNIPTASAQNLKKETELWIANELPASEQDRYYVGKVQKVTVTPAKIYLPDDDGVLQQVYSVTNQDVYLTLTVSGKERQDGFYLQNTRHIASGLAMSLQTDSHLFEAVILDVAVKK